MTEITDLGVRKIIEKGASLTVTIPIDAVKALKLEKGDNLAFSMEDGIVYIEKQKNLLSRARDIEKSLEGAVALLGRPLTKEERKKILSNLLEQGKS
jgi:antitoxin component of MazEF toxin-antitoxin module